MGMPELGRRVGLPLPTDRTAAEQLQKFYPSVGIRPLPPGQGGRAKGDHVGINDIDPITFFAEGDTGGVKDPDPQIHVINAQMARLATPVGAKASFKWHNGDWNYYNDDPSEWAVQVLEPNAHLPIPIVGIAGNHDGDDSDGVPGSGIAEFMANQCMSEPRSPRGDLQMEYGRQTQTQPYVYWTLALKAVTIIGLYTNVPSGGHMDDIQTKWLFNELEAAPVDRPLIVSLHHPPYSIDAHHGGSQKMGYALDGAFTAAMRWPDLVMAAHVHDYQRFARTVPDAKTKGKTLYEIQVPYIVLGNGGYHNLHGFAKGAAPGEQVTDEVQFVTGDDKHWGFMQFTCGTKTGIQAEYISVDKGGNVTPSVDAFAVPLS